MRSTRILAVVALLTALGTTACSSGPSADFDPNATGIDAIAEGDPVSGNVRITYRQLGQKGPQATFSIVNASSEFGQRLRSGRATSTETRVATDEQVGRILATFEEAGFFEHARPMRMGELPDLEGRKGAVVVERDGESLGLMLVSGQGLQGSPIPPVYRDCKVLTLKVHEQLQGIEIRTNEKDPEKLFQDPRGLQLERGR